MYGLDGSSRLFELKSSSRRGVPVVIARGELDLVSEPYMIGRLEEAEAGMNGIPRMVVDLRRVTFMDLSGLRPLLERLNGLWGAELRLVVSPAEDGPVRRLLGLTRLGDTFQVYEDLDSAVGEEPERVPEPATDDASDSRCVGL